MSILAANDTSVLEVNAFDSENLPLPLTFTSQMPQSRLFASAGEDIIKIFATEPVTMNLHHDGVDPQTYQDNQQ
jgi:gamma-glutamyl hydrolase